MIVIVKFDTNKKYLDQFSGPFRRLYHLHKPISFNKRYSLAY